MPNGREHRMYDAYGHHDYPGAPANHRIDCAYGCGCWIGGSSSGSEHLGVDPFGKCPNNVSDGKLFPEKENLADFVEGRIKDLEKRLATAKMHCQKAETLIDEANRNTKIDLQKRLSASQKRNQELQRALKETQELCHAILKATGKNSQEEES